MVKVPRWMQWSLSAQIFRSGTSWPATHGGEGVVLLQPLGARDQQRAEDERDAVHHRQVAAQGLARPVHCRVLGETRDGAHSEDRADERAEAPLAKLLRRKHSRNGGHAHAEIRKRDEHPALDLEIAHKCQNIIHSTERVCDHERVGEICRRLYHDAVNDRYERLCDLNAFVNQSTWSRSPQFLSVCSCWRIDISASELLFVHVPQYNERNVNHCNDDKYGTAAVVHATDRCEDPSSVSENHETRGIRRHRRHAASKRQQLARWQEHVKAPRVRVRKQQQRERLDDSRDCSCALVASDVQEDANRERQGIHHDGRDRERQIEPVLLSLTGATADPSIVMIDWCDVDAWQSSWHWCSTCSSSSGQICQQHERICAMASPMERGGRRRQEKIR
ncbi:hypothetical protein FI667_g1704, partial [Globisporangium splendens]